jgi:hypothetical protein
MSDWLQRYTTLKKDEPGRKHELACADRNSQKLNIFRNRVRKKAPAVYEIDTPTGKTEISFPPGMNPYSCFIPAIG